GRSVPGSWPPVASVEAAGVVGAGAGSSEPQPATRAVQVRAASRPPASRVRSTQVSRLVWIAVAAGLGTRRPRRSGGSDAAVAKDRSGGAGGSVEGVAAGAGS